MASQGIEIEIKFDVDEGASVPRLDELPGVARVGTPHTAALEAVYFDTDQHTLASRRITLRRRTGGIDAGWHLKLPPEAAVGAGPQPRRELHAPLGRPDVVPDTLLAHVQAYLRGTAVRPQVRLQTRRTTHALYGEGGEHLADLADDDVEATTLHHGSADEPPQRWREWELELVDGSPDLFPPAAELLAAAGARPAAHASKLARALAGSGSATREALGGPQELQAGKKAPAAAVVTVYLAEQIRQLLAEDAAVRLEEPDGIHNMRSAIRRIRSALAAYRKLYRAMPVRRLRDELAWLGLLLGEPRDSEVVLETLRRPLEALPSGAGRDAAREQVERKAAAAYDAGYRLVQEALQTERYFRLLDNLEDFRDHPPVRAEGAAPGRKLAAKAVEKSARRLRRSHKAATRARRGTDHENALHQVRKDAKRLRHVAESARPVHGKRAGKIAKAAHKQQDILGDFHDAVIARNLVQDLEAGGGLPESAAEALAVLRTRQTELMEAAEAKYRKARKKSRGLLRRGVL